MPTPNLRCLAAVFALLLTAAPARSADQGSKKMAAPHVRVKATLAASRWLAARKARVVDGVLQGKSRTGKAYALDLTHGDGALYFTVNPGAADELAVGIYDRGKRYAALELGWNDDAGPWVAPLAAQADVAAKLFPKKLR